MKSYCWEIYLTRVEALKFERIKRLEEFSLVDSNIIGNVGNCDGGQWHSSDDLIRNYNMRARRMRARMFRHAPARTPSRSCPPHTLVFGSARTSISGRPTILPERRLERPSRDAPRKSIGRSSSLHIRRMPKRTGQPLSMLVSRGLSSSSVFPRQC